MKARTARTSKLPTGHRRPLPKVVRPSNNGSPRDEQIEDHTADEYCVTEAISDDQLPPDEPESIPLRASRSQIGAYFRRDVTCCNGNASVG